MSVVENFAFESMDILNPRLNSRGDGDGIFRMEFPLMQWIFAWFYKWFGSDLTIARILTFFISTLSILGFYRLLRMYRQSELTASIGAWCFAWSPVLFYYSVNPLPDNLALCFGVWSLAFLKEHQQKGSTNSLIAFALFLALATAVKLPFVVFGAGYLPIFFQKIIQKEWKIGFKHAGLILITMLPTLTWYAWVIPQWKNTALIGGIGAETAFDYRSAVYNIWGVLHSILPELLINYGSVLFFLVGIMVFLQSKDKVAPFMMELFVLAFTLLFYLYEVNMIGLAHDYYLFPFLPLIFLLITAGVKRVLNHHQPWFKYVGIFGLVILPFTAYLRADGRWRPMGNEKSLLLHKDELRNLVPNEALVVVGNDPSTQIYLYHLDKKGWTFEQNWLTAAQLQDHIEHGAKFLYSNTEFVRTEQSLHQFLGEPIFDKDGIAVYPLQSPSGF